MTPRHYHPVSNIRIRDSENAMSRRWPPLERGEEALAQMRTLRIQVSIKLPPPLMKPALLFALFLSEKVSSTRVEEAMQIPTT